VVRSEESCLPGLLVLVVHALHRQGCFVLVQPVLCDFSARLDCAKKRPAELRQLPRPASFRTADMVLFFSSTALGADKPVVIYAGKDKVRSSPARTARGGEGLTPFLLVRSSKVRRPSLPRSSSFTVS